MIKTIIKEAFIILLLLIAIVLIFSILFYEYIPTNKTIPSKLSYQLPEEIANEMQEAKVEEVNSVNVIYQIDESELKTSQKANSYKPGRINPFASITTANSNTTGNNTVGNNTTGNNNTTGTYFNNAGSK